MPLLVRRTLFTNLLVVLFLSSTASAQDFWTRSFESIRAASSTIHSLQASFTQRKYMRILKHPLVSTGSIAYQSPDRLRWEYIEPIRQVLLVNGSKIQKYITVGNKLVADNSGSVEAIRMVMEHVASWIKGDFEKDGVFSKELRAQPLPGILLKPITEPTSRFIRSIALVLGKKPGVLERIEIQEFGDASTVIEFSNVVLNSAIADSVFESAQ
jgi:outer membrane lipoprotein-sorting protein